MLNLQSSGTRAKNVLRVTVRLLFLERIVREGKNETENFVMFSFKLPVLGVVGSRLRFLHGYCGGSREPVGIVWPGRDAYATALEIVRNVRPESASRSVESTARVGHIAVGVVRVVRGHAIVTPLYSRRCTLKILYKAISGVVTGPYLPAFRSYH